MALTKNIGNMFQLQLKMFTCWSRQLQATFTRIYSTNDSENYLQVDVNYN